MTFAKDALDLLITIAFIIFILLIVGAIALSVYLKERLARYWIYIRGH